MVGASSSTSGWPSPSLLERTGEGLLVVEPCWLLCWTLTGQQQSELQATLGSQALIQTLGYAVPKTLLLLVIQAIQDSLLEQSLSSAKERSASVWQQVIVALARACDPELDLDTVPLKAKRRQAGVGVALRSSRHHEQCGDVLGIRFTLGCGSSQQEQGNVGRSATFTPTLCALVPSQQPAECRSVALGDAGAGGAPGHSRLPTRSLNGIWQLGKGCQSRLVWHRTSDFDGRDSE